MSCEESASAVKTLQVAREVRSPDGRRGLCGPLVVHRGVLQCLTVLEGPVDVESPAHLAVEVEIDGGWVVPEFRGVEALLVEPELSVGTWRAPGAVTAWRVASPWIDLGGSESRLPPTARANGDGFWGPALVVGDTLVCAVVSQVDVSQGRPTPERPVLQAHDGVHWQELPPQQGGGGWGEDGRLLQFGHWTFPAHVVDLRLAPPTG